MLSPACTLALAVNCFPMQARSIGNEAVIRVDKRKRSCVVSSVVFSNVVIVAVFVETVLLVDAVVAGVVLKSVVCY